VFDLDNETYSSIYNPKVENSSILGYAHNDSRWFLMLGAETFSNVEFILIEKDTSVTEIPVPDQIDASKILSLAMHKQHPEFVTFDSSMTGFEKYRYNVHDNSWKINSVSMNSFYKRIAKPVASFYYSGWHYVMQSNFRKREELYVPVSNGSTNLLFFKNDVSMYYHDEIVNIRNLSLQINIDASISGIIKNVDYCKSTHNSLILQPLSVSKPECPENYQPIRIFYFLDNYLHRLPIFTSTFSNNTSIKMYDFLQNHEYKEVIIEHRPEKNVHVFITNNDIIGKTSLALQNTYLIPFHRDYILLSDNAEFCRLNDDLERIDKQSLRKKIEHHIIDNLRIIKDNPLKFKMYAVPFYILFFPLTFVVAFLLFFVKKVFLTPRKPAYSRRYIKQTYFASFFGPFCILHILLNIVFLLELFRFFKGM